MTSAQSGEPVDADEVKRRDVLRLSAALAAFGVAMGIDAGTGHAIEFKKQDALVSSGKEKTGPSEGSQKILKKSDGTQKGSAVDTKSSKSK